MSDWASYLEGQNMCPECNGAGYEVYHHAGECDIDDCPAHCDAGYLTQPRTLAEVREEDRDIAVGLFREGWSTDVAWPQFWQGLAQEARRRTTHRRAGK